MPPKRPRKTVPKKSPPPPFTVGALTAPSNWARQGYLGKENRIIHVGAATTIPLSGDGDSRGH
eukprot:8233740-Pyramimonas_sp.AAC.1